MRFVIWNGQQQLYAISQQGTLQQYWTTGNGVWNSQALGQGYVPGALEVGITDGVQLHLFALKPDGGKAHLFQNQGESTWNVEQLAAA